VVFGPGVLPSLLENTSSTLDPFSTSSEFHELNIRLYI
jgi:uncharacterized protein YqjF (DUF2071 family)